MRYDPKKIEEKWHEKWLQEKVYEPDLKRAPKPFYNLMMFPYPSAEGLHIGSVRTFSGIDIYGRFKRMQGYDVFEPIGLDGFGIHSENYALKTGKHPFRHAKDSEENFYRQLSIIGNGFAWEEKLETYDQDYYKWTQWIFTQMFKHGLAYRKKSAVNWCPSCKTVLADEQVLHGECERCQSKVVKKDLEQWFFRITNYAERLLKNLEKIDWPEPIKIAQRNWIGKSEGAEIDFEVHTKTKPNFVLLHGYKGSPAKDFFPWLKKELEKRGYAVYTPSLPSPAEPNIEEQVNFLLKNYRFNEDTVIVTHSLGGVDALKLLPKLKVKVRKLVMVAPPLRVEFLDGKKRPALAKATDWKFNFSAVSKRVKEIVVIQDVGDVVVPPSHPEEIAKALGARLNRVVAPKPHFNCSEAIDILRETIHSLKIFTTRPDTLFGATYMVLGPEHPLLRNKELKIRNYGEVEEYIKKAKAKTDEERIVEGKEKTGVELRGIKAVNPANGEEIPVWVADYVLGNVGTGAIMAVPAHDERDFAFAKKFKLPVREVVEPLFEKLDGPDAVRDGKSQVKRRAVSCIVKHWKEDKYLCIRWKKSDWHGFVTGGIEGNEEEIAAAEREIEEETGYTSTKFVKNLGGIIHARFFHLLKDKNHWAHFQGLYFELADGAQVPVSQEEKEIQDVLWLSPAEVEKFINIPDMRLIWDRFRGRESTYTGEGILTNSGKFNGMNSKEARWEITEFVGGNRKTQYRLRDWLISRQRYWGPPIPVIYCENCARLRQGYGGQGWQPVPESDLPVKLPYIKNYRPAGTGRGPLAAVESFYKVRCPKCKSPARRETDVSDTFLDSAWYYLRYPSIKEKKRPWNPAITKKWFPVDSYIGGAEHAVLHLLYVRFLAMALQDIGVLHFSAKGGEEPFKQFRTHGMITKDGAKMSKSRGNIVNPDEYINAYGSDAIRMYLAFLAPLTQGGDFRDEGIRGITRFLERIWKISKSEFLPKSPKATGIPAKGLGIISKQPLHPKLQMILHKTIKEVTEDIGSLQYNTAISALMILLNEFEANPQAVGQKELEIFLKLLAPFAPHLSEELWQQYFATSKKFKSIHLEPWPKYDPKLIQEKTFELVIQVNGKMRGKISLPAGATEIQAKDAALKLEAVKHYISGAPKRIVFVPNKLINFVV